MKKILTMLVAFALVLAMSVVPAMADVIGTTVSIAEGQGQAPIVLAKWEQQDPTKGFLDINHVPILDLGVPLGLFGTTETGDTGHVLFTPAETANTQINPPCVYQTWVPVEYYAVVMDCNGLGTIINSHALVDYPDGTFKYKVVFAPIPNSPIQGSLDLVNNADLDNLVVYGDEFDHDNDPMTDPITWTKDAIINELNKGTAQIWHGTADLYYEDPAGDYTVEVIVQDSSSNYDILINKLHYVPTTCFALDNDVISYGEIFINQLQTKPGDTIFSSGDGMMTVRNLGNTGADILVGQDDMGFGITQFGDWNVGFNGRVGHNDPVTGAEISYLAYEPEIEKDKGTISNLITLPGWVQHSTDEELDFGILLNNLANPTITSPYTGTMIIASEIHIVP